MPDFSTFANSEVAEYAAFRARLLEALDVTEDDLEALDRLDNYGVARREFEAERAYFADVYLPAMVERVRARVMAEVMGTLKRCAGNDPACPCQDGDVCHYRDDPITSTDGIRPHRELTEAEAKMARECNSIPWPPR